MASIVALESGTARYAYALNNLQSRGKFFYRLAAQEVAWRWSSGGAKIVASEDPNVNVCKSKNYNPTYVI